MGFEPTTTASSAGVFLVAYRNKALSARREFEPGIPAIFFRWLTILQSIEHAVPNDITPYMYFKFWGKRPN